MADFIKSLSLQIVPFGLKVEIGGVKRPAQRWGKVYLPKMRLYNAQPLGAEDFSHILDRICEKIAPLGYRLSFDLVRVANGEGRLRRIDLARAFGQKLLNGHESLSLTEGREVWLWQAVVQKKSSIQTHTGTGAEIDDLLNLNVRKLRHVVLNFGTAPGT